MGRFQSWGEVVRAYSRATTVHGLRRAGWAHSFWAQIVWFLVFVVGLGAFFWLAVSLLKEYHEFPIKSVSTTSNDFPTFPSVSICNGNPKRLVDKPDADKKLRCDGACKQRKLVDNCTCGDSDLSTVPSNINVCNLNSQEQHSCHDRVLASFTNLETNCSECVPDAHAGNPVNMVLYCSFGGRVCSPVQEFSDSRPSARYGGCHTFNGGKPGSAELKKASSSGPNFGLSLILTAERYQHLEEGLETEGFRVVVHPPNTLPNEEIQGFSIPTAMEVTVALQQKEKNGLQGPYADCEESETDEMGYTRTSMSCASKCGSGSCDCAPPCHEVDYQLDLSLTAWPSLNHQSSLLNLLKSFSSEGLRDFQIEEMSSVKIFFKDFSRTTVSQEPAFTLARLFTQIGGLSALFIGISILTLCEFGEMIISFVVVGSGSEKRDPEMERLPTFPLESPSVIPPRDPPSFNSENFQ